MKRPTTSYPCRFSRYAATELSTPPLIARTTRAGIIAPPHAIQTRLLQDSGTLTSRGSGNARHGRLLAAGFFLHLQKPAVLPRARLLDRLNVDRHLDPRQRLLDRQLDPLAQGVRPPHRVIARHQQV